METNNSEYWNNIWLNNSNNVKREEEDQKIFTINSNSILWQRMYNIIVNKYTENNLNKINSIEIGAGKGVFSALLQSKGIQASLLDFSEVSKNRADQFFLNNCLKYNSFIKCDALKMKKNLYGKYDIVCSFGTAEHFTDDNRIKIIQAHLDLLKPGGLFFISVPNKLNFPYMFYKTIMELTGKWSVEEYPFTPMEMKRLMKSLQINDFNFFGGSIRSSLKWLFFIPSHIEQKINSPFRFFSKIANNDYLKYRLEKGTLSDKYFAYALVVYGTKD